MPVPATASSEQLRWIIEAALAQRNWTIHTRTPNTFTAQVRSQGTGERAIIQIAYRPGVVEIRPVEQKVSRQRYDRWVKILSTDILQSAAQLAKAPAPATPSTEPAAPSPPAAAPAAPPPAAAPAAPPPATAPAAPPPPARAP
jgi:hypothetical protein